MCSMERRDDVTPERRRIMQAVRQKNTKPEVTVRRLLHRLGYRFRLHRRDLPGSPDIVLPKHRTVIFVHGCFWHRHGCKKTTTPKIRRNFWEAKFAANVERDRRKEEQLREAGWRVLTIWECQVNELEILAAHLRQSLPATTSSSGTA